MTAQLTAPAAMQTVLMSEAEARECVRRIRSGLEDIRVAGLDLEEREGWRALGYTSWRECASAEFGKSVATVYRQLRAGKIDREISQVEKSAVPLPTVQADELARLPDAESRQTAYRRAAETSLGATTRANVKAAVDEHLSQMAERRSVGSASDRSDNQDMPDDARSLGFEPDLAADDLGPQDEIVNQDAYPDARGTRCRFCGDHYRGDVCPCGGPPIASQDAPGQEDAAADTDDDLSDEYPNLTAALAKERASSHPSQDRDRPLDDEPTNGKSSSKSTVSASRVFSPRPLDAGDLTRTLLDLPTAQIVEAISENATPAQRDALRQAFGASGQTPATAPVAPTMDLRAALGDDGCTILALTKAISETFTVDARASLLALLADDMPAERLQPLAHRLTVRTRGESQPASEPRKPAEIAAEAAALTPGLRRSTVSQIAESFDAADDLEKLEAVFRARRSYLQAVSYTVGSR